MKTAKTKMAIAFLGIALLFPHQCAASPPDKEQATAIKRLQFLVGTWKSVDAPNRAPAAPEIRTITVQPDGLSLTVTTESVAGKHGPVRITFEPKSGEYLLTSTTSDDDERIFHAKLIADGRLQIPLPQSSRLFSGMTFIVRVNDGKWTETLAPPSEPSEPFYRRSFVRQHRNP